MINRPVESKTARLARLMEAVENYKNSVEFIPLAGGKIIIPDDVAFLINEIKELEERIYDIGMDARERDEKADR